MTATAPIRSSALASIDDDLAATTAPADQDHRPVRTPDPSGTAAPASASSAGAAGAPLAITDGQRDAHGPTGLQPLPERHALPGSPAGEHDVSPD